MGNKVARLSFDESSAAEIAELSFESHLACLVSFRHQRRAELAYEVGRAYVHFDTCIAWPSRLCDLFFVSLGSLDRLQKDSERCGSQGELGSGCV